MTTTTTRTVYDELHGAAQAMMCEHRFLVSPPDGSLLDPSDCTRCGTPARTVEAVPQRLRGPIGHLLAGYAHRHETEVFEENDIVEDGVLTEVDTERHEECGGVIGEEGDGGCPCFHNALDLARAINGKVH